MSCQKALEMVMWGGEVYGRKGAGANVYARFHAAWFIHCSSGRSMVGWHHTGLLVCFPSIRATLCNHSHTANYRKAQRIFINCTELKETLLCLQHIQSINS